MCPEQPEAFGRVHFTCHHRAAPVQQAAALYQNQLCAARSGSVPLEIAALHLRGAVLICNTCSNKALSRSAEVTSAETALSFRVEDEWPFPCFNLNPGCFLGTSSGTVGSPSVEGPQMRVLVWCVTALAGLIPAAASPTPSDGKRDWVGTWVLDRRLSTAPFFGLPDRRSDTITADEMNIIIRTAEVSYGTTEVRVRRVALDGKEHEVSAPGASRKGSTQ